MFRSKVLHAIFFSCNLGEHIFIINAWITSIFFNVLFLLLFKKTNLSVNGIKKAHSIRQNKNYFLYSGKNVHSQGISERISWWSKERDNLCPGNMIIIPVLVFSSLKLLIIKWVATLHCVLIGNVNQLPCSCLEISMDRRA